MKTTCLQSAKKPEQLLQTECRKIMIETHAPEECKQALKDAAPKNEREARAICEEIMFKLNAPDECVKAGLKDHKECGKFMFQQNAPEECIDAGITGENRNDPRKCEELMRSLGESQFGDNRGPNRGPGPGFNPDCKRIENSEERLKCYDGALQGFENRENFQGQGDYEQRFRETKEREKQCAESCSADGGAWSFYKGECVCRQPEFREERRNDFRREEFREGEGFRPPSECEGLSPEECSRKFSSGEFRPPPGDGFPQSEFRPPEGGEFTPPPGFSPPQENNQQPPEPTEGENGESSGGEGISSGESGSGGGITGSVIFEDNDFLDYYFK